MCRRMICSAGLSPRMRGNLRAVPHSARHSRSIPAYAGEPTRWALSRVGRKVYPRVCGGTRRRSAMMAVSKGLSPRMRGNLATAQISARRRRSIPAYAGEPETAQILAISAEVYPRVCGGTLYRCKQPRRSRGLSPRMRGNRRRIPLGDAPPRSIPAYAGEPTALQTG